MTAFLVDTDGTLTTSLQAYWPLNEGSRSRYDSINPGSGPAGQFTRANSEFLSIADNSSLSLGSDTDFTIACWVYITSKPSDVTGFVSKWNYTTASNAEYHLGYSGSAGDRFELQVGNGTTGNTITASSFGSPALNTWYFVVAWHDATANTINIQVNNGTVDSAAHTIGTFDAANPLNIGASNNGVGGSSFHDGRIQLAGFWKRVLTSTERTSLYNSGNGKDYRRLSGSEKTTLISYWNLHEGSGTRVDSHGSNDLTDNNTVTQATGAQVGNTLGDNNTVGFAAGNSDVTQAGASFIEANSEYLSTQDNSFLSMEGTSFTVACWVYLTSKPAHSMRIFSKEGAGANWEYSLQWDNSVDRFRWSVNVTGGDPIYSNNFGAPATGTWNFVVCIFNTATNEASIRVNNGTANTGATTGSLAATTVPFNLGSLNSGAAAFLDGRINEIGVWKRVLTSQEQTDLYNGGVGNTIVADGNTPGVDEALIAADVTGEFLQLFP